MVRSTVAYASYAEAKAKKPFRWWYDAIIDWRLANPGRPEYECAHALGCGVNYLSLIVNTDMFKARWEQRRSEFSDQIGMSVQQKLLRNLDTTLDIIHEQLTTKRTAIPFRDTTKLMDDTLQRLGYGVPRSGVQVNVGAAPGGTTQVAVNVTDLHAARALLRSREAERADAGTGPAPISISPRPVHRDVHRPDLEPGTAAAASPQGGDEIVEAEWREAETAPAGEARAVKEEEAGGSPHPRDPLDDLI